MFQTELKAQNYNPKTIQAEYFWGTVDPGAGNGAALTAADGNLGDAIEAVIASGISAPLNGLNLLNVRVMGTDGTWGALFKAVVSNDAAFTADIRVVTGEYFIDTDNGAGNNTALIAFDGNYDSAIEAALNSGINAPAAGLHTLGVRFKGLDGVWGPLFNAVFNVDGAFTADIKITAGEYFFDTDPGAGNGIPLIAADGNYDNAIEAALKSGVNAPAVGLHTLCARFIGQDGTWGPLFKLIVNVDNVFTADLKVISGEYFFDTDPGLGNGFPLVAADGNFNSAIETAISSAATNALTTDLHVLCVRTKGLDGTWGPLFKLIVIVDPCSPSPTATITSGSPTTICPTDSVVLTASSSVGDTYQWRKDGANISGATSVTFAAKETGAYTVAVTNSGGCSNISNTINVTVAGNNAPQVTIAVSPSNAVCAGSTVTFTATPTNGGTAPIYQWRVNGTPTGTNSATLSLSTLNNNDAVTCIMTSNAACVFPLADTSNTITMTVFAAPLATINASGSTALCPTQSVTISALAGYSYLWSNNAITQSIVVTAAGSYRVTVTDGNNCTAVSSPISVTQVAAPSAAITPVTVSICNGSSASLTASGGTAYTWSNSLGSNATVSVSPTSATTYTVTVTNANNCSATASRTVTVKSTSTGIVNASICQGQSYFFNGANRTVQGTYLDTLINVAGCDSFVTLNLIVNALPTAAITPATVSICSGSSASLTASGGTAYSWSNSLGSNATVSVSPTTTSTYTVTVTNANNCSATASRTVTVTTFNTGSISASICQGQSYFFNGADRTVQGAYLDTLTSVNGCDSILTLNLTVNALPTAAISPATASVCSGSGISLTVSGGTAYTWSNSLGNNATVSVSPTSATTYTVTVTNADNCSATASRTVTVKSTSTGIVNASICQGQSYFFNGANRTSQGVYLDTLTNSVGCDSIVTLNLTVNAVPVAGISPASATICNGASVQLTASGGVSYTWSNTANTAVTNVSPSNTTTYTVTVTGANNCSATASRTVTVNSLPAAAINGPTTICTGLSATLTASGGTSYSWSNGLGNTAQITVSPGSNTSYIVTVTDINNCSATASATVDVTSAPVATISGATQVCAGESVSLTANGGNTYQWANGLGNTAQISVSPTTTTTYTVTATVGVNCSAAASHTIVVYQAAASQFSASICAGGSYAFNGQQLTQGGSYKDTLQTVHGCDSVVTLNLTVNAPLTGNFTQEICTGGSYTFNGVQLTQAGLYKDTIQTTGGCDSIVTLNLIFKNALQTSVRDTICDGATYLFNGTGITQGGVYSDTLTSSAGCDSIVTLTLVVNSLPVPVVLRNNDTLSTQVYASYQWLLNNAPLSGATNPTLLLPANGNYSVLVTDANGCSATSAILNVTSVGLSEVNDVFDLKLYPNPNQGEFILEFTDDISRTVQITDALGRTIFDETVQHQKVIDLYQPAAGVYFIHVWQNHLLYSRKFTIIR